MPTMTDTPAPEDLPPVTAAILGDATVIGVADVEGAPAAFAEPLVDGEDAPAPEVKFA